MAQKRNSRSSVVSVMEDENIDLLDFDVDKEDDSVDYIETDLGTDHIEDIVVSSTLHGVKSEDFYMMDSSDSSDSSTICLSFAIVMLNDAPLTTTLSAALL